MPGYSGIHVRRMGRKRGLPADDVEKRSLLIEDIFKILIGHEPMSHSELCNSLRQSMGSWHSGANRWSFGPRWANMDMDELMEELGVEINNVRTKPNKHGSTQIRATYYNATEETKEKYEMELMTNRILNGRAL